MAEDNPVEENKESKKTAKKGGVSDLMGIGVLGIIVAFIVVLWLVSISYYAFAFFCLGMLPSIVAIILDRGAGRFASRTVSACNFVGILPFLFDIGIKYDKGMAAKSLMATPFTWLVVYGGAMVGWMLIWVLPQMTMMVYTVRADVKRKRLINEQNAMLAEWGEEVKTGKPRSADSISD